MFKFVLTAIATLCIAFPALAFEADFCSNASGCSSSADDIGVRTPVSPNTTMYFDFDFNAGDILDVCRVTALGWYSSGHFRPDMSSIALVTPNPDISVSCVTVADAPPVFCPTCDRSLVCDMQNQVGDAILFGAGPEISVDFFVPNPPVSEVDAVVTAFDEAATLATPNKGVPTPVCDITANIFISANGLTTTQVDVQDVPTSDADADGILDFADNCLVVPNGPLASTGLCSTQLDGDNDGYGNPCDTDTNNDGATGVDDVIATYQEVQATSTDPNYDFNCDGAVGVDDLIRVLGDSNNTVVPGPSGLACAGTVPCP